MSSILKALKKLEDEKATHKPDTLKIDSDILRVESPQRYSTTGVVLAALLLFAGGSIATYMFMKQEAAPVAVNNKPMQPSESTQLSPKVPVPAAGEIKAERLPVTIEIVPAQRSETTRLAPPKRQRQTATAKSAADGTPLQHNTQLKNDEQKKIPTVTAVQPTAVTNTVPVLMVNGIAYQDGIADSVAVVNGVPVAGGSMVEGAKVEVVQKDRVRFSYKGETFDVPLGKSNR